MANPKERWTGSPAYREEMCEELPEMYADGSGILAVCVKLGVSDTTYYNWVDKYPKFAEADARGRTVAKALALKEAEELGKSDKKCNSAVYLWALKHKHNMHDKAEITIKESDNHAKLMDKMKTKVKQLNPSG